jgi:hypothetical protein
MLRIRLLFAFTAIVACINTTAFQPSLLIRCPTIKTSSQLAATRREVVEAGKISSMAALIAISSSFIALPPKKVLASGGATAGGAYLLSVRLRVCMNGMP